MLAEYDGDMRKINELANMLKNLESTLREMKLETVEKYDNEKKIILKALEDRKKEIGANEKENEELESTESQSKKNQLKISLTGKHAREDKDETSKNAEKEKSKSTKPVRNIKENMSNSVGLDKNKDQEMKSSTRSPEKVKKQIDADRLPQKKRSNKRKLVDCL